MYLSKLRNNEVEENSQPDKEANATLGWLEKMANDTGAFCEAAMELNCDEDNKCNHCKIIVSNCVLKMVIIARVCRIFRVFQIGKICSEFPTRISRKEKVRNPRLMLGDF